MTEQSFSFTYMILYIHAVSSTDDLKASSVDALIALNAVVGNSQCNGHWIWLSGKYMRTVCIYIYICFL